MERSYRTREFLKGWVDTSRREGQISRDLKSFYRRYHIRSEVVFNAGNMTRSNRGFIFASAMLEEVKRSLVRKCGVRFSERSSFSDYAKLRKHAVKWYETSNKIA